MNNTRTKDAYRAADGRWRTGGSGETAGQRSAEVVGDRAASSVAAGSFSATVPVGPGLRQPSPRSDCAPDGALPLRLVQVYLTPGIYEFLRQVRSMAIMQDLDVTASAVVRHAMERLIAMASAEEMVELLGSAKGQNQRRRGRPRR
jgi:hypothetical protein